MEKHVTNSLCYLKSFFGMNLDKINGSPPLPFKLFFIIAFPLVAATVIIPLVALPLFRFLVAKFTAQQNPYKHLWILLTFTLYIISDTMQSFPSAASAVWVAALALRYLATGLNLIHLSSMVTQRRQYVLQPSYIRKNIFWYIFYIFTLSCFAFGLIYGWVELAPYVIYYLVKFIQWVRNRRRNASKNISSS